jgi:phage terminase large subunit GpA-like protein
LEDFKDPAIRQIALCFSAQSGKTQTMLVMLGYVIDQDPGPVLAVQSSLEAARSFSKNRLQPLLDDCPSLARHKTEDRHDFSAAEMRLDNCSVYLQGAGNAAQLASRPIRYLFADETDKWKDESKREADSLSLAKERVKSFRNHKIVLASTPTVATGPIWQEFLSGDQRRYHVPCPHCGTLFVLQWQQVKWPEDSDAKVVVDQTWLECPHCQSIITERHKSPMLEAGQWIPSNQDSPADRVSYHLSELYSPWTTWGSLAAKFIRATKEAKQGNTGSLHNFVNSSLAEPWEDRQQSAKEPEAILALEVDLPAGVVPPDAVALTAGVDTQDTGFWFTIWAWSQELTGHLVREGFVPDLLVLDSVLWAAHYQDQDGRSHPVRLALIDSQGHRTAEVYEWCRLRPQSRPLKGEQRLRGTPWASSMLEKIPGRDGKQYPVPGGLQLIRVDTNHFKTLLSGKLAVGVGSSGGMTLHKDPSADFIKHMASEFQDERGIWRQPGHKRCDLWDCSVYALAAAELLGVRYWHQPQEQIIQLNPKPVVATRKNSLW